MDHPQEPPDAASEARSGAPSSPEALPPGASWRLLLATAEPSRLRILGLLAGGPRPLDDLARESGGDRSAFLRDLDVLEGSGWIRKRSDGMESQVLLDLRAVRRALRGKAQSVASSSILDELAPAAGIRRRFFDGDRLRNWPSRQKDRELVLEEILRLLPPRRSYREMELNLLLGRIYPDFCSLRRELVDRRYMERASGIYCIAPRGHEALARREIVRDDATGRSGSQSGGSAGRRGPGSSDRSNHEG